MTKKEQTMSTAEVIAALNSNPHFLQMIEEVAKDAELLKRVEAGDVTATREASERAKDHFLELACGIIDGRYREDVMGDLKAEMAHRVYRRVRTGSN